ncbi:MAG: 2-oxoglutarate dehydrogenase E1 component [Acidobacteria bacterium]|nr:MAG: 2-oxoglutarate dehydrogenase E1 component [Acidobacteriota bacterium]
MEDFLKNRSNLEYIEALREKYLEDPNSVDTSWQYFFSGMEMGSDGSATHSGPINCIGSPYDTRIFQLITSYRKLGHLNAQLDPLEIGQRDHSQLDKELFGFSDSDLDLPFPTMGVLESETGTLREIIDGLTQIYCGTMGADYVDSCNVETELWFHEKIERNFNQPNLGLEEKRAVMQALNEAELFERFLHTKYVGQKRFSIEGGEALIPCLNAIIETLGTLGADEVIFGMPHRGRLNVLSNIMNKNYSEIFHEFEPNYEANQVSGDGDVKYHKGFVSDYQTRSGHPMHLTLVDNPSHLEVVGSLVEGLTRANQTLRKDDDKNKIVPVLIHGDAAFSGQGVVSELLNMSQLEGYSTGGTIHIVLNNQIGFTTDPEDSRSTPYCTDVARHISAPVFHINGDDVEMLIHATRIACEYRQRYHKDIVIDLICFRKHGHNEGDEPMFTQPLMYKAIKKHPTTRELYLDKLVHGGSLERAMGREMQREFKVRLQKALDLARSETWLSDDKPDPEHYHAYYQVTPTSDMFKRFPTSISPDELKQIVNGVSSFPASFKPHPKVKRLFEQRIHMLESDKIDWGLAELITYGSLLKSGIACRLSGQDVKRGTFSHRHAVAFDYETGKPYTPLDSLAEGQPKFQIYNSLLSEMAVLGFEFGYSLAKSPCLVIWEAQFGDFANGAQVIVDQFISSSESKWNRVSDLVMFLPHGYEGQGPEHSSARLERYLQSCAENNMQVANLTTPAQLFHILRRQILRDFQKPLIIMTPKSLLRHPLCVSKAKDFTDGNFKELISDSEINPEEVTRIAFCSGKVYYDLLEYRREHGHNHVALVRLEQLYPLPCKAILDQKSIYKNAKEITWVQEEPMNMGAWSYLYYQLELIFKHKVTYIGRKESASPAVGSMKLHRGEQDALVKSTFEKMTKGVVAV